MQTVLPKQLQTCRRLALLSVGFYATSLLIGVTGLSDFGKHLRGLAIICLFAGVHPACLANLTLAWGWYHLRIGNASGAAPMGVASVALAAFYCFDPLPVTDRAVPLVIATYCVWVGSMVVLIAAPHLTRGNSVTPTPIP